jgi:hypothetical protein
LLLILGWSCAALAADSALPADYAAPPPSSPPKRSTADLEKLVAPIALYPDPLIATILPASVYPLEIVQAARFVANTNNLEKLDAQPWDENVKAVARVPAVIQKMNEDLGWTMELGEAFLAQDTELMDAIQGMRARAQKAGTLQTTPQQVVVVTNIIIEKTIEQQVVVVTNTIVQIQPSNPQVIYVPTYNPYTVYYPSPAYVYNPYAPLVTFGVGIAVGAIIANNCDWRHGGIYVGHHGAVVWGGGGYHGNVNVNRNVNINNTTINNVNRTTTTQKWQPDQSRLSTSGTSTAAASARSMETRGWGSAATAQPSTRPTGAARPTPSTGTSGARPSTGAVGTRPSTGTAGAGTTSAWTSSASRPTASPSPSRPSPSPSVSQYRSGSAVSHPSSSGSAFGGMSSGGGARDFSSRGAASRGGHGGAGGGRGGARR